MDMTEAMLANDLRSAVVGLYAQVKTIEEEFMEIQNSREAVGNES